QGSFGDMPLSIESLAGPQTTVTYELASGPEAQWISLEPHGFYVPRGGKVQVSLRFQVDARAELGDHTLSLYEYAFNRGQSGVLSTPTGSRVVAKKIWKGASYPTSLLVVAPDAFRSQLQPLITHKISTGMPSFLVTIETLTGFFANATASDAERIKRGIAEA